MSMPVSIQNMSAECSRLGLRTCLAAAASILLATSIGAHSAFAKDSKNETKTKTETKSEAVVEDPAWDSYAEGIEQQVLGKWFPPAGVDQYKGVILEVRIRKDGRLSNTVISKSSQIDAVDAAAKKAITDAAPFKPFPEGIKVEDFARFEIKLDKADVSLKRRIVRKIDKFSKPSKPEKDDPQGKQSF